MKTQLICLTMLSVNALAEHDPVKARPAAPPMPQINSACWDAELMRVHDNLINDQSAAKTDVLTLLDKSGKVITKYKMSRHHASDDPGKAKRPSELAIYQDENDACNRVFAFAGSSKGEDWDTNLDFRPRDEGGAFHPGFLEAAAWYKTLVQKEMKEIADKGCPHPRLTFTGHSLGGAVANLMVNWVLRKELIEIRPIPELVVFGSPRVKIEAAGAPNDISEALHYYIAHDPVVNLPLRSSGFANLTTRNLELTAVAISSRRASIGNRLIQNHLPDEYLKKMIALCRGTEKVTAQRKIASNLGSYYFDALSRQGHDVREGAANIVAKNAQVAKEVTKEAAETVGLATQAAVLGTNQPGNVAVWNAGDGASYARQLCKRYDLPLRPVQLRRDFCYYYKNESSWGFNLSGQEYCADGIGCRGTPACEKGCEAWLTNFCRGTVKCP